MSIDRPDLIWKLTNWSSIQREVFSNASVSGEAFAMNVAAFCGSIQDDGVGEDQFPNNALFRRVAVPCVAAEEVCAQDICGDGTTFCLDCAGNLNGDKQYDACGVCNGNGMSCIELSTTSIYTKTDLTIIEENTFDVTSEVLTTIGNVSLAMTPLTSSSTSAVIIVTLLSVLCIALLFASVLLWRSK